MTLFIVVIERVARQTTYRSRVFTDRDEASKFAADELESKHTIRTAVFVQTWEE